MAFHMDASHLQYIYQYALHRGTSSGLKAQNSLQMQSWVNAQNDEGTTCLHLAAFKGDLQMIKFLISVGADPTILNYNGLSLFHIAAQGDQPISMAYFAAMPQLDLRQRDSKNGTALHWACFLGCENSVNFLLSLAPDTINLADNVSRYSFFCISTNKSYNIGKLDTLAPRSDQWECADCEEIASTWC